MGRLILACLLALSAAVSIDAAKIAAFNIQVFGVSKIGEPVVVSYLVQILDRYDITLIQEIRDSSDTAIHQLLADLNAHSSATYAMALGPRVGRTSSKEQYAYFYRTDKFSVADTFTFNDIQDHFEREPYCVLFNSLGGSTSVSQFFMVGIHAKPEDAVNEIDYLHDVYNDAKIRFGTSEGIVTGDFNADCSYVGANDWQYIRLWTDTSFTWLISNSADTTVKSTDCAYDRIVLNGPLVKNNAGAGYVFDYQTYYGLSQVLAEDISDHYPVYFNLY